MTASKRSVPATIGALANAPTTSYKFVMLGLNLSKNNVLSRYSPLVKLAVNPALVKFSHNPRSNIQGVKSITASRTIRLVAPGLLTLDISAGKTSVCTLSDTISIMG